MRIRSLIIAQALCNSFAAFGTVRAVNGIFGAKSLGFFLDVWMPIVLIFLVLVDF